ncbi:27894_t:CDS:2, partial [Gigaspora margarita]
MLLDKLNNDFENEAPLFLPNTLNSIDSLSFNTDSPIDNAKIKPRLCLHIPILSQLTKFYKDNEITESSLSSNDSIWHRWRKRIRKKSS